MRMKHSQLNKRQLLTLENELRKRELIHRTTVQTLLNATNKTWNPRFFDCRVDRLRLILNENITEAMRNPDDFRPYCPESLSRTGSLHLLDQMDGVPIHIDPNKLLTGLLVLGPQQAGKSRFITHLYRQIQNARPDVKITIIDPKAGFSNLNSFRNIDLADISLDLAPPANIGQEKFLYELMPILGDLCGLIYGIEILNEAAWITLNQYTKYNEQADANTAMCLADIYESIAMVNATGPRRPGYRDAAKTALSRILGQSSLFRCRGGLSLDWLFNQNTVLNARCLTDEWMCRFLAVYLLYWLYQRSRFEPETNELKHIVIIDDASRFIGAVYSFEAHTQTSVLGHILAVLRATGTCLIATTQLPAQVDPAVLALSRNMVVVGNINGEANLRIIKNSMSLTDEQSKSIVRFQKREALAFISDSTWPYPIHGWTPKVEIESYTTASPVKAPLDITPWHSLTEIPQRPIIKVTIPPTPVSESQSPMAAVKNIPNSSDTSKVKSSVDKLVLDCIHCPCDKARDHAEKMDSFREYDTAKTEAMQNGLLIASQCGKSLYLIPTQNAYDKFGIINPYDRSTSIEHAFYVQLAAHTLKYNTSLKIQTETPIGSKGATIDVTTVDKSGNMAAYEITLSTSNLLSNAAKLQDTTYAKIVWLCRDAATANAVKAYFHKSASLTPEFLTKFEYIHFGKWIPQNKDK